MNCRSVRANLSAFIDREVPPDERHQIRAHLAFCDSCRLEESELRSLKDLLNGIPAPDPSPDFEVRLIECIHQPTLPSRPHFLRFSTPLAFIAGVAAISIVTVWQVAESGHSPALSARTQPAAGQAATRDWAAAVRQDQIYEAGASEPTYGAPILTAAEYGR